MAKRRCYYCSRLFIPDPRVGHRQKACSMQCQRLRKKENNSIFSKNNPGYWHDRYDYVKQWRQRHPDYQRQWREKRKQKGRSQLEIQAERMRLPNWANIFHERVFFDRPTQDLRIECWKRVLNGSIPLADDVDVEHLARDYNLSLEEIQAVVHRACLLMAAEDPEGLLNAETLEKAIRLVKEKSIRQECLFG